MCRTHYRPPTPSWQRRTVGLGLILAGLFLIGALVWTYFAVQSIVAAKDRPGAPTDPFGYVCGGVLAVFAIPGLVCVWRGFKELFTEEVITPPPDDSGSVTAAVRVIPESHAEDLVREIAEVHNQKAVLRQLGRLRPERLAGAARTFARELGPGETPLVLFDTSWMRNGRAGILVTNRRLYSSRLDGPIELQDITEVTCPDPSGPETGFKVLVFVLALLTGSIVLMWGRWFRRQLVVNREVVYQGWLYFHPEFWTDLLSALGAAARLGEEPDGRGPGGQAE